MSKIATIRKTEGATIAIMIVLPSFAEPPVSASLAIKMKKRMKMAVDSFRGSKPQDTVVIRTPRECACTTIGSPKLTFLASCIQYVSQLSGVRMRWPVQYTFTGS
jgi:hypothetical protein